MPPWRYKASVPYLLQKDTLTDFLGRRLDVGSFNFLMVGMPGIGKSETTIKLCLDICPQFNLKDDVILTIEEFWNKIDIGKNRHHCVKICDDFASELNSKDFSKKEVKDVIDYLTTVRTDHVGIFMTTTVNAFLVKDYRDRISDFFCELRRQNKMEKFTQGVVHYQQRNNVVNQTYHHSLTLDNRERINNMSRGMKFWGWIFYPPPEEMHQEYMLLRIAKNELNKQKGKDASDKARILRQSDQEIVEGVLKNPGPWMKLQKNGERVFNAPLFTSHTELSTRRLTKVIARIKAGLSEATPLSPTPEPSNPI
jgi:hypothetical protein